MGTDIHGVFQRHDAAADAWVNVPHNYEMDRHYQLFAVLAGVRNGRGFAGVVTGQEVVPISEPRGYPEGFKVDENDCHVVGRLEEIDPRRQKWHKAEFCEEGENPLALSMGDHSHSWLTGEEMLNWYANAPVVVQTGIMSRDAYNKWDKVSHPESYCGGVWGAGIITIKDNKQERENTPNWTHIAVEWDASLREECGYFFDEVARLQAEHGKVRFVFGFDS